MNFHDVLRSFLGSGFKVFVHNLRHRKRGRISGSSYQLHLADCGQKNACSALTLSSTPETIPVFRNLVTYTEMKLSFFLFNPDPFNSPVHGAKIVLSKQWFWFNFQSNLPAK